MKKRQRKKNEKRYKRCEQAFIEEMKLRFGDPPNAGIAAMAKKLQAEQREKDKRSGTDFKEGN